MLEQVEKRLRERQGCGARAGGFAGGVSGQRSVGEMQSQLGPDATWSGNAEAELRGFGRGCGGRASEDEVYADGRTVGDAGTGFDKWLNGAARKAGKAGKLGAG